MPIEQLEPAQAHAVLQESPDAVYLDVRTEEEFERGHPVRAVNVPVVFIKGPGQTEHNVEFLEIVEKTFNRDQTLIVGCAGGVRSQRACELLEQVGFQRLINVKGGFSGARDQSGEIVVKGWRDMGLPVITEGVTYAAIRAKARS
jgi:rhodanese-related sulfurtransferase